MPVVNVDKTRIKSFFPTVSLNKILEKLPFIGLDIEGIDKNIVRIEYNPNRPDFSSDIGIFRSLKGLFGDEVGLPSFDFFIDNSYKIVADLSVEKIRPFILFFLAKNKKLTPMLIEQLLSMQEDLHNGIARSRTKASIGLHDIDNIKFPLRYTTTHGKKSFVPLDEIKDYRIIEILDNLNIGKKYKSLLPSSHRYPILEDNNGVVLSLPPIINGDNTKITNRTKNLLIEITANDLSIATNLLAILSHYFFDEGFKIVSGSLVQNNSHVIILKKLKNKIIYVKENYINSLLGLNLSTAEILQSLRRSRLNAMKLSGNNIKCIIPPYRIDINHPVDIIEEVALGYGIYNLQPSLPLFRVTTGTKDHFDNLFNELRQSLIGLGFLEVLNFSLVGSLFSELSGTDYHTKDMLKVESSKSHEHEFLRQSIIPSLISNISYNIHEEYPQKIFEIGKVFTFKKQISETWNLGALIASSTINFTEIKSVLYSIFKLNFGEEIVTKTSSTNSMFMEGRCADIYFADQKIGQIGEITPKIISTFNIRIPVSGFEIDLSIFSNIFKKTR